MARTGRRRARLLALVTLLAAMVAGMVPTASAQAPDILTIGEVQGAVDDDDNGTQSRSPFAPPNGNNPGETVTVQGVIYQTTLARTSRDGSSQYGLFIQNTAETADDDETTSDGIFVFQGRFPTLRRDGGGFYTPQVGDEVVLRGPVVEFFNLTQLSNPFVVDVVRSEVEIDDEVSPFDVDPPAELDDANRYFERREGMRGQVPADSVVLNGRNVFSGTEDGEVWVARPDSTIAERDERYTDRTFRDPHPLDDTEDELFDNGNGYRILLGSLGIKADENDNTALIAPARTFDRLADAPVGGIYYAFGKYSVQVDQQIELERGVNPSRNAPPRSFSRSQQYSAVIYNVENLYDFRDDPFDGCDFADNEGCPGVSPPFDYVPADEDEYQLRLQEIGQQVVDDLFAPDIVLVQEAEDQDICTVDDAALICGTTDDRDGKPDTLQELAVEIAQQGGPDYDAAYDRDGADDRGIVSGFLYRNDRVQLLDASDDDPVLSSDPDVDYRSAALDYNTDQQNPKALNAVLPDDVDRSTGTDGDDVFTRAPQVGLFRIWRTAIGESVFTDLYTISNHFSSGPNNRVGQRREQAAYNAAIVAALQESGEDVRVIVGGDLNVYPRPDDPYEPGQPIGDGEEVGPSDQLGPLYDQDLINVFDELVDEVPQSAYNYIFQGQAQTLDQQFLTPSQEHDLVQARVAHINADWPAEFDGDDARGVSDHDPVVTRFRNLPTIERLRDLVTYFEQQGEIGPNTADDLRDLLDKADEACSKDGSTNACRVSLAKFLKRLQSRYVQDNAEEVLEGETRRLLNRLH